MFEAAYGYREQGARSVVKEDAFGDAAPVAPQVMAAAPEAQEVVGAGFDRAVLLVDDQQPEVDEDVAVDAAEGTVEMSPVQTGNAQAIRSTKPRCVITFR